MNQSLFYLVERRVSELNAFAKAPADIVAVAERLGFRACEFCQGLLGRILVGPRVHWPWVKVLIARLRLRFRIPNGSICLYQYPNFSLRNEIFVDVLNALRNRRIKLICIVHDIEEMRFRNEDALLESTRKLLSLFDVLIVHNASMRKMLAAKGLPEDRMIDLEVFDYLSNPIPQRQSGSGRRIVIAGNLDPKKAGYLSSLKDLRDVDWRLYGSNIGEGVLQGEHIKHCGSYPPEDLPAKIEGDYGLVWDGDSIETCSGLLGRYLRYNNPHKFSLYLRAGLPVIVWRESAIASFVEKHKVGLAVAALSEISTALSLISSEAYRQMQENCQLLSNRIGAGRYSEHAIRTAIESVAGSRGEGRLWCYRERGGSIMGILHFAAEALGLTREQRNRIVALYRARTHWVPAYYREVTELGVTREPRQVPITVSLTSFPARIKEIHRTINTLLTQTVKPDRVVLWLGEEKFPNKEADLPKKLLRLRDFGLTIRWTRDIRSYTKLLPAVKAYPDDIVITADDDIFYNPDMVERLYKSYQTAPECIHAQTILRVTVDADGRISPYNSWKYGTVPGDKSFLNHLEGVGGVLYPPHSLPDEVFNEEAYLKLTPTVDDIWFWSMAILNNVKVCDAWGGGVPPFQYNPRANGASSLWSVNIDPSVGNDRQFADLVKRYPEIGTKLKELKS